MKPKKDNRIKALAALILLGATVGAGYVTGIFESVFQAFSSINLNYVVLLRVLIMVFFVTLVKNVVSIILGAFSNVSKRGSTMRSILDSLVSYASVIVIICWGLRLVGVDVSTIIASVGIIALVVGFGAESLIADVITGMFMLFENQYNVGDIIEVNGFRGTIRSIGIRTTTLADAAGNIKIINNSHMSDILNRSVIDSRIVTTIGVPYGLDLEAFEAKLPEMLEAVRQDHPDVFMAAPVYQGVSELADSAVMLQFCADVQEKEIYNATRILNRDLYIRFKKAGVEIPFNQLEITQK